MTNFEPFFNLLYIAVSSVYISYFLIKANIHPSNKEPIKLTQLWTVSGLMAAGIIVLTSKGMFNWLPLVAGLTMGFLLCFVIQNKLNPESNIKG